uniref:Uncharacterized protein n=1 Tax=Tanacetum cinerariifolium TaxID=118510 RepID=A0A6L2JIX5_TANCI|nr:hypothetical protein [Tanacetum cinerariifolium]
MDDLNITIEEYIRLEEEKAQKRRKVFNWETSKYGKIWYDEDVYDLRSVETEFPAIVFNLTSDETLSCEPTVSSLNDNEIDFRISFNESDDEYYVVVFDKNSFSYKIIYANDLKTDSENVNEKVNMPLFSSLEPSVIYIDDLDFFKDSENEFPAIVYNDALTSKSDSSTEPTLCPQRINEFDLKDETSLFEYNEVEQNILYLNDQFPFNIIYSDDLKSDKDNDDNEIDMIQSLRGNAYAHGSNKILETSHDKSNKFFKAETFINEFNLKDETSLFECDKKEQNVLYFNDIFPFKVIYLDGLKLDKDNDDDKINVKQSSEDMSVIPLPNVINTDVGAYARGSNMLLETSHDTSNKFFNTKTFIKELNVNIIACNYLNKRMPFIFLIKNLYVSFGIPFNPKLFYKDGIKLGKFNLKKFL